MRSATTYPEHELQRRRRSRSRSSIARPASLSRRRRIRARRRRVGAIRRCEPKRCCSRANLYEQSQSTDRALDVYSRYVEQFPKPVETAVETRFKIAEIYKATRRRRATTDSSSSRSCASTQQRAASERRARATSRRARRWCWPSSCYEQLRGGEAAAALREEPAEKSSAWMTWRSRRSASSSTTRSAKSPRPRPSTWPRSTPTSAARCSNPSGPADLADAELQEYEDRARGRGVPVRGEGDRGAREEPRADARRHLQRWTEKSLARLADLMPGRYAKAEISSGFLGSIDRYAYRTPERPRAVDCRSSGRQRSEPPDARHSSEAAGAATTSCNLAESLASRTDAVAGDRCRRASSCDAPRRRGVPLSRQAAPTALPRPHVSRTTAVSRSPRMCASAPTCARSTTPPCASSSRSSTSKGIASLLESHAERADVRPRRTSISASRTAAPAISTRRRRACKRALELNPRHPSRTTSSAWSIARRADSRRRARATRRRSRSSPDVPLRAANLAILCDLYLADRACALDELRGVSASAVPDDKDAAMWIADLRTRAGQLGGRMMRTHRLHVVALSPLRCRRRRGPRRQQRRRRKKRRKQAAQGPTARPKAEGDVKLSGMSILGNEEAPKSLVIVPWKSSRDRRHARALAQLLDDSDATRRQGRVHAGARVLRDQVGFEVTQLLLTLTRGWQPWTSFIQS